MAAFGLAVLACHATPDEPLVALVPDVEQNDDPAPGARDVMIEPSPLATITYEGSGEMVHPDALVFPHDWRGSRYWYAATPYPSGNPAFENPSAYSGNDSNDWVAAPGVNPIALPAELAYLSDPDLSYDPVRDELRLYYRQTTPDRDEIFLKTSRMGYDWHPAVRIASEPKYSMISPAIVREADGSWRMWTVDASIGGCKSSAANLKLTQRRSRDGLTWGKAEGVSLAIPKSVPWHWDVQYVRPKNEYWALVAAFPDGYDCSRSAVYFARSADGTKWTVSPTPLLAPGALEPLRDLVYRSTFRYFAGDESVTIWFSGARAESGRFRYALATARYPFAELLRRVNTGAGASQSHVPDEPARSRVGAARAAFVADFP